MPSQTASQTTVSPDRRAVLPLRLPLPLSLPLRLPLRQFLPLCLSLPLLLPLPACQSAIPAGTQFAESRCQTVFSDGVDGAPTLELGAIIELTKPDGTPEHDGTFETNAMRLAVAELNDHRDIAGKRLRLTVCDTRADWSKGGGQVTRDLTTWLIEQRKVQAILTDASSDTQTAAAVAVPKGVLLMAISATSEDLTNLADKGLVWRVAPSDIYQGAVLASVASKGLQAADKLSAFAVQSPYGDGLLDALNKALGNRLAAHTFGSDGKGLAAAVQAAGADGSKAVLFAGSSSQLAQLAESRAGTPLSTLPLFAADGACEADALAIPLKQGTLDGMHCTRPGQPPDEIYKLFKERYQQKFALDATQSSFTQHAFDAVYCVALAYAYAMRAGGPAAVDGQALAEGLRHLSKGDPYAFKPNEITKMVAALGKGQGIDVRGASGPLDFNADTGEAPSGYSLWKAAGKTLVNDGYYAVQDQGKGQYVVLAVDVTP